MNKNKEIECPEIRYHITYDENLTLKELEDIINLIRISTNDALYEMGIPRSKANALQRIEKIEPGSIEIVMETIQEIIGIAGDIAGIISLTSGIVISIRNRIISKRDRIDRKPREDKKLYEKYKVIAEIEERANSKIYIVHIHVCKREPISC